MKEQHLLEALERARQRRLARGGASAAANGERAVWLTLAEIEACQGANTYPRLGKRAIRERCEALQRRGGTPRLRVVRSVAGLRTWVVLEGETGEGPAAWPEPALVEITAPEAEAASDATPLAESATVAAPPAEGGSDDGSSPVGGSA